MRRHDLDDYSDTEDRHGGLHRLLPSEPVGHEADAQCREKGAYILQTDHHRTDGGLVFVAEVIDVGFELENPA
jgi:hypothetical protein